MAEVLGLGLTHYPMLSGTDEKMAGLLRSTLTDPDIPAERKDPNNWSELAQREWGDDTGTTAAAGHRARLVEGLKRCREELDDFRPDVSARLGRRPVRELPRGGHPLVLRAGLRQTRSSSRSAVPRASVPNVWGLARGHNIHDAGQRAVRQVHGDRACWPTGVDIAYSYEPRKAVPSRTPSPTRSVPRLRQRRKSSPTRSLPLAVNCYGEHVIAQRGGMRQLRRHRTPRRTSTRRVRRRSAAWSSAPRPPRPCGQPAAHRPHRLVELVARLPQRQGLAPAPGHRVRPALYEALVAGDYERGTAAPARRSSRSGQHEMLNWFCLLGAMAALGLKLEWSDFVETEIFNSNKAFAVFR